MNKHSGTITLFGKPNVGKSSITNALAERNICSVNAKPQTTIQSLKAVIYWENHQLIFVDTPGIQSRQSPYHHRSANRIASRGLYDSDINLMVIAANNWTAEDDHIIQSAHRANKQIMLINKCDLIETKEQEDLIAKAREMTQFDFIVPISAKIKQTMVPLKHLLLSMCPKRPWLDIDELSKTEQQKKDIEDGIRGAMLTHLSKEIPYMTKINIREIKQVKHILHIHVDIVTDRASRKKLLIGKNGDMIKKIGQTARLSLETRWQTPVFLKTFILVDSS
tara:strand:- start:16070 stop:16906 length:837 start_codon:yes stop_codon:yes gene_type:complete